MGPVALLLLLWAVLERNPSRKWPGIAVAFAMLLIFSWMAQPVQYSDIRFQLLSEKDLEAVYANSIEQSVEQERPVLYYFHADWCTNCEELKQRLERQDIREKLNGFLLVSMDVTEDTEYAKASEIFGLDVVPSLAFASHEGKLLPVLLRGTSFPESALLGVLDSLSQHSSMD